MWDVDGPIRHTLVAGSVVLGLLGVAYLGETGPLIQYATWLLVFAIWMVWFIIVGRDWIGHPDL